jgi:hypothetical protein
MAIKHRLAQAARRFIADEQKAAAKNIAVPRPLWLSGRTVMPDV